MTDTPLDDLGLHWSLLDKIADLETVERVIDVGYAELLKTKGIGRKKLIQLRDAIKAKGFNFYVPQEYDRPGPTELQQRLRAIRKFNAHIRRRAKERGLA